MEKGDRIFLTIDIGTTAIRVSALDEEYKVLSCKKKEYQLKTEKERVTLQPDVYWNYTKEGIGEIIRNCDSSKIAGITVTTQGETLIPVDADGVPLYDALVWLDARGVSQAEKIVGTVDGEREKQAGIVTPEEFYQRTGIVECNGLCPISKLLWFKEEEPQIYEKTYLFMLLEDYIIYRLTGKMVTEKSLLSTTGYFDIVKDELWTGLLDALGLDREKIPSILECGQIVGEITEEVAGLGIPKQTLVVTGAMDQVCGAVGAGNYAPGGLTETTGTALCIGKTVEKKSVFERKGIPVYRHYHKGLQLLLPVCMTAGMALKWFKDNFCGEEIAKAAQSGADVYDLLSALAESSQPLSGGVIMLPYLNGSLQPYQAPNFKGGFLGVGLHSTKADFVRALMEGVGYMLRENLELLEKEGSHSSRMISMGGGAKSAVWCRIKADITGMEIHALKESETASIGAAMLCKMGLDGQTRLPERGAAGEYAEPGEEQNEQTTFSDRETVFVPNRTNRAAYEYGYQKYCWYLKRLISNDLRECAP